MYRSYRQTSRAAAGNGAGVFLFCEASGSAAFTRRCRPPVGRTHNALPYKPQQRHVGFASARTPAQDSFGSRGIAPCLAEYLYQCCGSAGYPAARSHQAGAHYGLSTTGDVAASGSSFPIMARDCSRKNGNVCLSPTFPARKGARDWG